MKVYHYDTPYGDVDMTVDILGDPTHAINATIMEIKYNLASGETQDQFYAYYPVFAGVQKLVSTHAALKAIATENNFTLKIFDQDSASTINSSTTTTTTTSTSTTTTTNTTSTTTTTTLP